MYVADPYLLMIKKTATTTEMTLKPVGSSILPADRPSQLHLKTFATYVFPSAHRLHLLQMSY